MSDDRYDTLSKHNPKQRAAIGRMQVYAESCDDFDAMDLWTEPPSARDFLQLMAWAVDLEILETFVRLVSPDGEIVAEYQTIGDVPNEYVDSKGTAHRTTCENVHVRYRKKA